MLHRTCLVLSWNWRIRFTNLVGHLSLDRITQRASPLTVSKAFVKSMKTATRSIFCSMHFSCTRRTEKIMSVLLRFGWNQHWASGRFSSDTLGFRQVFLRDVGEGAVKDDPSQDLSSDRQERDARVVADSLTAPVLCRNLVHTSCLIAFETSSIVGGRSRLVITGFCGIWSSTVGSTVEGLLSRVLKCSLHLALMLLFSLSKVEPSADRSGVVRGLVGL